MYSLLIPTPLGPLLAQASSTALIAVDLLILSEGLPERPNKLLNNFAKRVDRYFNGEHENFLDIPLDFGNIDPRRKALYDEVRLIPYGETRGYGEIGRLCGLSPRASGAGMRSCPFFLIIPAQRVIHANGDIGGFGGREGVKEWLLKFEGAIE